MAERPENRKTDAKENLAELPIVVRDWISAVALVVAVVLAYLPVWHAGYIWDDDMHLTNNPTIIGPLGLKEIWLPSAGHFYPAVLTTFWLIHAVWGLAPLPYHLVNVAMHAGSAVVLWRALRALAVPGAWFGAALWALHPLQVESVAWVSELKNTQSCLFYLLAILFYLRGLRTGASAWNVALCLLCGIVALESKSSCLVLLAVLPLCAWWMKGRWNWRYWFPPVFLLPICAVAVAITVWPQAGAVPSLDDAQWVRLWPEKIASSGDVIWFYLEKLVWPHPLMAIYPRWQIDASQLTAYSRLVAAGVVLLLLWLKRAEPPARAAFFAFAYFLVALSPFLGLLDQTFWRLSFVEDHLQYLAGMGPLALLAAGLVRLGEAALPGRIGVKAGLAAAVLFMLGILCWQRAQIFETETTLWADTLIKNPNAWLAHNNLGNELLKRGDVNGAIEEFEDALTLNPTFDMAHFSLGNALVQKGLFDDAMAEYRSALKITPSLAKAQLNIGNIYMQKGDLDAAIAAFQAAAEDDPYYAVAHNNLGQAFFLRGRIDEAIAQYEAALAINSSYAPAQTNLAAALARKSH